MGELRKKCLWSCILIFIFCLIIYFLNEEIRDKVFLLEKLLAYENHLMSLSKEMDVKLEQNSIEVLYSFSENLNNINLNISLKKYVYVLDSDLCFKNYIKYIIRLINRDNNLLD